MHKLISSISAKPVLAFLLGSLAVLGFAPFYLYPMTVIAVAGLFYLWHQAASAKQAAWLGFMFGLGLFIFGIYWIYISLHDFGGMPPIGAAFATFCLCAFMALFTALVGWLSKRSPNLFIVAPLLWALADWVRSWIFTGFPWLTLGYSQVPNSPLAGFAPVLGIYGVSLVTALTATLIALWPEKALRKQLLLGFILLLASGSLLKHIEWSKPLGEPLSIALLQGNITQDLKWQEDETQRTLDKYYQLAMGTNAKLIIAPETAFPILLPQMPPAHPRYRSTQALPAPTQL